MWVAFQPFPQPKPVIIMSWEQQHEVISYNVLPNNTEAGPCEEDEHKILNTDVPGIA